MSLYFTTWGLAVLGAVLLAPRCAPEAPWTARVVLGALASIVIVGSKLGYILEMHWFPNDGYFQHIANDPLFGFRIVGGIVLLGLALPAVAAIAGFSPGRFGDRCMPVLCGALVLIHLGCFANGCCFGEITNLPWGVTYPVGSWAFHLQARREQLDLLTVMAAKPVHPLQLYHASLAGAVLCVSGWALPRSTRPGEIQALTYMLLMGGLATLEVFRPVTMLLYSAVAPVLAAICGVVFLSIRMRRVGKGSEQMRNRVAWCLVALGMVAWSNAVPAQLRTASGTWTSGDGTKSGGWSATFGVGEVNSEGVVTTVDGKIDFTNMPTLKGGKLNGSLSPGKITFGVMYDSVEQGTFEGTVAEGGDLSGTFELPDGFRGTWEGEGQDQ